MAFPFVTIAYIYVSHTDVYVPVLAGELRTKAYATPYAQFYARTLRL